MLRGCRPDLLLVTGARSPYAAVVEKMYRDLDKDKVTILKVDNVGDVLAEAVSSFLSCSYPAVTPSPCIPLTICTLHIWKCISNNS